MSFSSFKKDQMIFENFRKFVNEEGEEEESTPVASPSGEDVGDKFLAKQGDDLTKFGVVKVVDFLNSPQGQDSKVRNALRGGSTDGAQGDEVIAVEPAAPSVRNMGPTQNEISLMKSVGWPLSTLKSVNNVATGDITGRDKRIVSSGDLVIDGHHRWSSTWAVAGKGAKINATNISLPGGNADQKLAGAQLAIAATIDPDSGKIPSATAKDVDDEGNPLPSDNILGKGAKEIAQMILDRVGKVVPDTGQPLLGPEYLEKIKLIPAAQKYWGLKPEMTPDQVKSKIVSVVAGNLSQLPPPQGPQRDYMPQFDGGDTHKKQVSLGGVVDTMRQGRVNYKAMFESKRNETMKITKTRLEEIVKEELKAIMSEDPEVQEDAEELEEDYETRWLDQMDREADREDRRRVRRSMRSPAEKEAEQRSWQRKADKFQDRDTGWNESKKK